jgi:hypothetical protein
MKKRGDVLHLGFEFTVLVYPVPGQIGTQIGVRRNAGRHLSRLENIQDRTGFWIADTEKEKVEGFFLGSMTRLA